MNRTAARNEAQIAANSSGQPWMIYHNLELDEFYAGRETEVRQYLSDSNEEHDGLEVIHPQASQPTSQILADALKGNNFTTAAAMARQTGQPWLVYESGETGNLGVCSLELWESMKADPKDQVLVRCEPDGSILYSPFFYGSEPAPAPEPDPEMDLLKPETLAAMIIEAYQDLSQARVELFQAEQSAAIERRGIEAYQMGLRESDAYKELKNAEQRADFLAKGTMTGSRQAEEKVLDANRVLMQAQIDVDQARALLRVAELAYNIKREH